MTPLPRQFLRQLAAVCALALLTALTSSTLAPAQTALPPGPSASQPVLPPAPPARPVADSVVRQAEDHAEGVFGSMSRAAAGGQIQDAWDDTDSEAGVFAFTLCEDCTYKVRLREHMVTVLELPDGEIIERADVGDGASFSISTRGSRRLAIKPLGFGVDSNLVVYGRSGIVYPVYLRAEGFNSRNVPDLFVRIQGQVTVDPDTARIDGIGGMAAPDTADAPGGPAPALPTMTASGGPVDMLPPEQTADDFVKAVPFDPDALRGWGDYKLWAGGPDGDALRPETVFRDDTFTYLRFGERWQDVELPTAYVVVDGIDELVNTRVQGRTYIIESTRALISLKSGLSYLCIQYEGGDA